MRLSKRTEYGVRAVVQLARLWPQGFIQAKDLSKQEHMPNKFLEAMTAGSPIVLGPDLPGMETVLRREDLRAAIEKGV